VPNKGEYAVIVGGDSNSIRAGSARSIIGGGQNNYLRASNWGSIVGGRDNTLYRSLNDGDSNYSIKYFTIPQMHLSEVDKITKSL
jgi:hypothetical protein